MKKAMSIFMVLAMLLTVMLAGCGTDKNAATPTPTGTGPSAGAGDVQIRVSWWGDTKRHEMYNQILDRFEDANPGITTVREPMSWADYWDKLKVQSAGGGAPDFICMHPQFASDYLRRGVLESLDSYIADGTIDLSKMSQGAVNSGVVDGVNYMIPMGLTSSSMFVNVTMLKELGLDAPDFNWTWDDLKALGLEARKTLDDMGKKNVWIIDDNSNNYQLFRYWIRQEGRELYTTDGGLDYSAEDVEAWWAYWKDLRENGIVPDAATTIEYKTATLENYLFAQRMIAFRSVPANQFKLYVQALPDQELTIIRNPSKTEGEIGEYTEGAHFTISAKTSAEKKLAAAKAINFWVNTEESYELFGMDQGVPPNNDMAEFIKPGLVPGDKAALEFVGRVSELASEAPPTVYPPAGASEIDAAFQNLAEEVMYDAKTPKQAADDFMSQAQGIIEKNK